MTLVVISGTWNNKRPQKKYPSSLPTCCSWGYLGSNTELRQFHNNPAPGFDFYCSTAHSRTACPQPLDFTTEVFGETEERIMSPLLNLTAKAWFILIMLRHCRQKMALSLTSLIWLEGNMPSDISIHRPNYWVCLMLVKQLGINSGQIFLFVMDGMQYNCETNTWS